MKKAICIGNGLDFHKDLSWLIARGFTGILISGNIANKLENCSFAKECGMEFIILDIAYKPEWKECVDLIDAEYYYIDEPYANVHHTEEELRERLEYITNKRPNSKFVIGDLRIIQEKKYKPIENLYYVFTSYTDDWLIPIWDKCIPFGLPNQTPSIKRIHKKTNGKVPWIWVYGQNKMFCHPDEYHKLVQTAEKLDIPILFLYLGDGVKGSKYELNAVSEEELLHNIHHFIHDEKPYTLYQWWQRFFYRLKLSFSLLFKTWDFKEFFNTLF
jgi:hypothetical protein